MACSERTGLKQVYYQGWNRSPAQVECMRQVLRAGARGRLRWMGWRGRWEGGLGWETHVNSWLIHVNVWQKPLQYWKVTSLQLIKIKKKKFFFIFFFFFLTFSRVFITLIVVISNWILKIWLILYMFVVISIFILCGRLRLLKLLANLLNLGIYTQMFDFEKPVFVH